MRLFELPPDSPDQIVSCHEWNGNADLIADVARIGWISRTDETIDLTYGRGNFWKIFRPDSLVAHDIDPKLGDGVDFRQLPHEDGSFDVAVFDPPYINRNTTTSTQQDFASRYGVHSEQDKRNSFDELWQLIAAGLAEAARVTRPGGRILAKSMSYTNGRTFRHVPAMLIAYGETIGLDIADEFILKRSPGPLSQKAPITRSRRNCSTLLVFAKRSQRPRSGPSSFAAFTRSST